MDALVYVKILDDNNLLDDPTDTLINLNHMTHCVPCGSDSGPEGIWVYFANGSHVIIHGNYEEFITFVKTTYSVHSFE